MRSLRKRRRGVLLLVVLGMLAMFAMIGLTFVMLTGQARRIAEVGRSMDVQYVSPRDDLDRAMAQVARGSTSTMSAIGPHSLLEDLYGPYTRTGGRISSVNDIYLLPGTNGPVLEIASTGVSNPEQCGGCVLTMLNGPAAGTSARILAYLPSSAARPRSRFQVLPTENLDYNQISAFLRSGGGQINYIINGAEFSGRGLGINTGTGQVADTSLQPGLHRAQGWNAITGEANEDYDAPDHQNMLLAMVKGRIFPTGATSATEDTVSVPVPSLHRPDLARFMSGRSASAADMRYYLLRPMQRSLDGRTTIHRGFTGSNPSSRGFNAQWDGLRASGDFSWDVDNDGDGVADSVWVDLGMSVRSTADGRLYKPLFAILCTDLDGRLNLNAHGCIAQLSAEYYAPSAAGSAWAENGRFPSYQKYAESINPPPAIPGTGMTSAALPHGLGIGPAEINLRALFDYANPASTAIPTDLRSLWFGRTVSTYGYVEGRYGEGSSTARPGLYNGQTPFTYWLWGRDFAYQYLMLANSTYWAMGAFDSYGTPPDWNGNASIGVDLAGRPIYWGMGERRDYAMNSPYEMNLFHDSAWRTNRSPLRTIDNPFTLAELERILRPYDVDSATLPSRLLLLTSNSATNLTGSSLLARAADVTTDSWDLPCAPVAIPPEWQYNGPALHLLNVLQRKIARNGGTLVGDDLVRRARQLLPFEMLSGLRMNLNRPLGNGRDDNNNNVVDEAEENESPQRITYCDVDSRGQLRQNLADLDLSNGMALDDDPRTPAASVADRKSARQFFARNLYVLGLLVCDEYGFGKGRPQADTVGRDTKRMLAQWAVNVVDFFDRDSIMTRFDYDNDPFDADGWNPPGHDRDWNSPGGRGGIVFGCERPELLLTETLAFHDRRTEDRDDEQPDEGQEAAKTDDADEQKRDTEFDQRLRPQGSLFIELYNPWSRYEAPSGEIHTLKGGIPAVDLSRTTPAPTTGAAPGTAPRQDPVWQILVTKRRFNLPKADTPDPEEVDALGEENPKAERAIYFANPAGLPATADCEARVRHYSSTAATGVATPSVPPLQAGEYAVVGPGRSGAQESTTYLGFLVDKFVGDEATRRIVLRPHADATRERTVEVLANNHDLPATLTTIKSPAAIIVDRSNKEDLTVPPRLCISEPVDGYAQDATAEYDTESATYRYAPVIDVPVDLTREQDDIAEAVLEPKGMTECIRVLHLRRLANPLKPYDGRVRIGTASNPDYNPYRTVDSIPVDLVTFNGTALPNELEMAGRTPKEYDVLDTRERGEHKVDARPNVWRQEPWDEGDQNYTPLPVLAKMSRPAAPANHNYDKPFMHTLGYLNSWYGELTPRPKDEFHRGDPPEPFPWLVWNNRPFYSAYELLYVPGTICWGGKDFPFSSDRLLRYSDFGALAPTTADNYAKPVAMAERRQNWPYRHLQDYFESRVPLTMPDFAELAPPPIALYRILDYVGVPSRYVGTQIQLDPRQLTNYNVEHYFHAPFNWVSAYRDPGRVNINTVYSYDVFRAVMNNTAAPESELLSLWDKVVRSRRADAVTAAPGGQKNNFLTDVMRRMLTINPNVPSRFGNPFRSYAGGTLRHETVRTALRNRGIENEVHATLLRADPDTGGSGGTPLKPLFRNDSTEPCRAGYANPYFRFQNYTRLANMITTRSNVYAVWITVGYFQVRQPDNNDATLYPDGWELGQELGMDSGEVRRHRAFYIFDRTIPVGFVRGQDLNYEKALRLRRYIE